MKRRRSLLRALRSREEGSDKRFRATVYTAIVPSSTFINVTSVPSVTFRRFTPCGQYLISLSRNQRDLVVYRLETGGRRPTTSTIDFSTQPYSPAPRHDGLLRLQLPPSLPAHSCPFSRFFTQLHSTPIATGAESLAPDFCLSTTRARYVILASYSSREDSQPPPAPLPTCPVLDRFTLHLVEVTTGEVADRFCLTDDFVSLDGNAGVHMRGDMMVVLSLRNQTLHIIKVQESLGRFSEEARIGANCSQDDELVISRARDAEATWRRRRGLLPTTEETSNEGLGNGKGKTGFYTGLMQRLLVYVYRRLHGEGNQELFYRVVGQYSLLIMQKAQLLGNDHLLIRLGSYDRGKETASSTCFFVVYCISTTKILNLYDNFSKELLDIYDKYRDEFIGDPAIVAALPETRREEWGDERLDQSMDFRRELRKRTRAALAALPVSCQSQNSSPYLDRRIFSYNVDRLPALDGSKALFVRELNSVKFTSVESGAMRLKLCPGIPVKGNEARARSGKRKMRFLFHPVFPFVLSLEYSLVHPTMLNFHVYAGSCG